MEKKKRILILLLALPFIASAQQKIIVHAVGTNSVSTDTTPLHNQIDARVKYTDTVGKWTANVVYLSSAGILSDADLSLGSTSFGTDQTAAIQAILDRSSAVHPLTVYWDVKVSVTGDSLKSNTTIIAPLGCGAILRDNSNKAVLSNYHATPGTLTDSNITIIGGIWNGNGYRGGVAKQSGAIASYGNVAGIRMDGVKNLIIRDLTILNTRSWATCFFTTENVLVSNVRVDQGANYVINQDGVHFEGYAKNIKVYALSVRSGDDALAFNSMSTLTDGLGNPNSFWYGKYGSQTNIDVQDLFLDSCYFGIGIMTGNQWTDNINIRNVTGKSKNWWLVISNYIGNPNATTDPGPGNVGNVTISDISVKTFGTPPEYGLPSGYGMALINCNLKKLIIRNYTRNFFNTSTYYPALRIGGNNMTVGKLVIDGFYIDSAFGASNKTPQIEVDSATVRSMSILNATVRNTGTDPGALISVNRGATVNELILNGISTTGVERILRDSATVNYLSATNIRHISSDTSIAPFYIKPTGSILDFFLSGFWGFKITEGTFPSKRGDGFEGLPPYP